MKPRSQMPRRPRRQPHPLLCRTQQLLTGTRRTKTPARKESPTLDECKPGSGKRVRQTLSLTVTNNNTTLFDVQPAINLTTGELTYTAAPNKNGTATVT